MVVSTEKDVQAESQAEARGIIKGLLIAQMPGFKLERLDPMKVEIKVKTDAVKK